MIPEDISGYNTYPLYIVGSIIIRNKINPCQINKKNNTNTNIINDDHDIINRNISNEYFNFLYI